MTSKKALQTVYIALDKSGIYPDKCRPQLDACPTGDQEVVVLIPTGLATFFRED